MDSSYRQASPADLAASRLAAILDATDEAVIETSLAGIISGWNNGACRLFNYTADEMLGQTVGRLIPDDCRRQEETLAACLARGEARPATETQYVNASGRRLDVSIRISPVFGPDGGVIGAARLLRDITRAKHQQHDFERSRRHSSKPTATP